MAESGLTNKGQAEKYLNYGTGIGSSQLKPAESSQFNRQFPVGEGG
jgi:hypothetical protein